MVMQHEGSLNITKDLTVDSSMTVAGLAYPTSDGTNGQVIQTNGAGTLSFTAQTGGGGNVNQLQNILHAQVYS